MSAAAALHVLGSPAPAPCEIVQRGLGGLGPCEEQGFARRSSSRRRRWLLDQCQTWAVGMSERDKECKNPMRDLVSRPESKLSMEEELQGILDGCSGSGQASSSTSS